MGINGPVFLTINCILLHPTITITSLTLKMYEKMYMPKVVKKIIFENISL